VEILKVMVRDVNTGRDEFYLTRNIIIATGGVPSIPKGVSLISEGRVFHTNEFLNRIKSSYPIKENPYKFIVVGSGQSAAEIFHYLLMNYPNADITATMRQFAFKPADDSLFVNEIFFPEQIEFLYDLSEAKRKDILNKYRDTNYSAVDLDLIQMIYKALYNEKVSGINRARIVPFLEFKKSITKESFDIAYFYNSVQDQMVHMEADGIILATGYSRKKNLSLLDNIQPYFEKDDMGNYKINRNYTIIGRKGFRPNIFLQGYCEDTHGLSDTLLSILADRSQEILQSLKESCQEEIKVSELCKLI
jgi:L-ornithine N5-oxygenase